MITICLPVNVFVLGLTNYKQKLVGLGADGASVNRGGQGGVQAKLRDEMPWIVFVWCMNHRLELSVKDALKKTYFNTVDEMLLRIYYLYEKSPKKLRELKDIHEIVRETFEFEDGGVRPIRACGTRWLAHKTNAISRILDKYGIYITHLENVASDKNYAKDQQSKMKGYLKDWRTTKMLVNLCFYLDILSPLKKLSLILQKEGVDTVEAADAILKSKRDLDRLYERDVIDFPHVAALRRQINVTENDNYHYKGVELNNFNLEIELLSTKKQRELNDIKAMFVDRLEVNDSKYFAAVTQILNCEGWER